MGQTSKRTESFDRTATLLESGLNTSAVPAEPTKNPPSEGWGSSSDAQANGQKGGARVAYLQLQPHQRIPLKFETPDGSSHLGRTARLQSVEVFIETDELLQAGTPVKVKAPVLGWDDAVLEEHGIVAWVCPRADEFGHASGIGIRLTKSLGLLIRVEANGLGHGQVGTA